MLQHLRLMGQGKSCCLDQSRYKEHHNSDSSLGDEKSECCCFLFSTNVETLNVSSARSGIEDRSVKTNLQQECESLKGELEIYKIKCVLSEEKNETLLSRLSELMGKQLQENNPHITNLNDPNRPQKLAEVLGNIYDNEWTDAFSNLQTEVANIREKESIEILFDLLKITYNGCLNHVQKLIEYIQNWFKDNEKCEKNRILYFVESIASSMTSVIKTEINKAIVEKYGEHVATICKEYSQCCVIVCFYMAVKTPEAYLQFDCPPEQIDNNSFKPYTRDGEALDYIVWPALFLYKGGPLMAKGVVQCRDKIMKSLSDPC